MAAVMEESGWEARLRLVFGPRGDRTRLIERARCGPLSVQRAFYPEGDVCHVYVLHPPGGVVGGDLIDLSIRSLPGSRALLTAPGATKYYRSAAPWVEQRLTVKGVPQSELEYLPQENIYFPGARVRSRSCFELQRDARLVTWEIHCLGLPARSEAFTSGEIDVALELWRDGRPLLLDRLRVTPDTAGATAGLRGLPVTATLLATPCDRTLRDELQECMSMTSSATLGMTLLDDVLVVRSLGTSTAAVKHAFMQIWRRLRPRMLGRTAQSPRIWAT